jgi:cytochrome oxidase Cu insertion factor (SCO1/SenC/PrrC family)
VIPEASRPARALAACLCAAALAGAAGAHEGHDAGALGSLPPLRFEPPAAGSYSLPVIRRVSEHRLLDSGGRRAPLLALAPGQCAVVAFVYLSCADPQGCPLSTASLLRIDRALAERAELRDRVRLATVSFDPARDPPESLAALRERLAPRGDWRFYTGSDAADLAPVLEDYGQYVLPLRDASGEPSGPLRHVMKVFLVDARGAVRAIYSAGTLDPRIVLLDVETLLMQQAG